MALFTSNASRFGGYGVGTPDFAVLGGFWRFGLANVKQFHSAVPQLEPQTTMFDRSRQECRDFWSFRHSATGLGP